MLLRRLDGDQGGTPSRPGPAQGARQGLIFLCTLGSGKSSN